MNRSMLSNLLLWFPLVFGLILAIASCSNTSSTPAQPEIPGFDPDELRAAPESLLINNVLIDVAPVVWRYRPLSNLVQAEPRPLFASAKLYSDTFDTFPRGWDAEYLWVLNGNEVWGSHLHAHQDSVPLPPNVIRGDTSGGPDWPAGTEVDVVVGVTYFGGVLKLVLSRQQVIREFSLP